MSYKTQFPSFGEMDVSIPAGFTDASWKDDICPSFDKTLQNGDTLKLWVDFANPDDREVGGPRFNLSVFNSDGEWLRDIVQSDDFAVMLNAIEAQR